MADRPLPVAAFLVPLAVSRAPSAGFAAMGIAWGALMASMPDIKAQLGVGDGALGGLLLVAALAAIAMMLLAPGLGRRLGPAALPVGTFAMGLAVMLPAQDWGPLFFVGAMLAMGGSSGAAEVWFNARISTLEAGRRMALMNLNHALYSFAYAGAAALAGLARATGWSPQAILGAAGLAVLLLALAAVERGEREAEAGSGPGAGGGGWRLAPVPLLAGALLLVAFLAENAAEAWSALYIERDLGAGTGAGAAGPALLGLTMGVGRLAGQLMASRLGDQALLRIGLWLGAAGVVVVIAAPGPAVAYAGFIGLGLGISVLAPTALSVAGRLAAPAARAHVIAQATVIGYLGFFLGPGMLGMVAELGGLRLAYGVVALALMAGLALRARLARHEG
ncbi:MAG: MFS transporter [Pararhodobacter sp.]|nr:MFS transporter [Pararhodobacter sp.]